MSETRRPNILGASAIKRALWCVLAVFVGNCAVFKSQEDLANFVIKIGSRPISADRLYTALLA